MHIVPGMILSLPVNANGSLIPFEEELNIWPFALIQMAFSDILELGSQQKRVGMLWHSLSLSSSSADELNKLCHPSYRNQTWLNTSCPQETAPSYTNNGCYIFWNSACPKNVFIHGNTSSRTFTFLSTVYMRNIAGASANRIHIVGHTISTCLLKLSYGSKTWTVQVWQCQSVLKSHSLSFGHLIVKPIPSGTNLQYIVISNYLSTMDGLVPAEIIENFKTLNHIVTSY